MSVTGDETRPGSGTASRWAVYAPVVAAGGAVAYGLLRTYWTLGHRPPLPPNGDDLGFMSDWGIVTLCAAAAVLAPLAARTAPREPSSAPSPDRPGTTAGRPAPAAPIVSGWAGGAVRGLAGLVGLAIMASAVLIVLDLVALVFPGIGIPTSAVAFGSRAACFAVGAALVATAVAARRRARGACAHCGRTAAARPRPDAVPRRAVIAGYLAVAGCLTRLGAQAAIGFGPRTDPFARESQVAGLAFLVCMVLAGTLLPLALVHRWGRVFPRRLPGLAGRRVPRAVPLVPAALVSGGMLLYFGTGLVMLTVQTLTGRGGADLALSPAFVWVAVGAYVVWGSGLAVAARSYAAITRPACRRCGRGGARTSRPRIEPVASA